MSEEPTIDPLEEREQREAEVRDKRLVEDIERDNETARLGALLEDERFRDYLWATIAKCNTLGEAWDANYGKVSYNCGRQSVGRMLIADINLANPQAWLSMQLKSAQTAQNEARVAARRRLKRVR
jgi:hypothetical protein